MYLDYLVDVPEVKGKITFRSKGNARYVYYEYDRIYDPDKKYTTVKRVTIGKVSADDELKMRPNENFKKYFPEVETPEERLDAGRSSCLKAGAYMVISKTIYRLDHAVSKTQKVVLSAFGISAEQVKYKADYISEKLRGK